MYVRCININTFLYTKIIDGVKKRVNKNKLRRKFRKIFNSFRRNIIVIICDQLAEQTLTFVTLNFKIS